MAGLDVQVGGVSGYEIFTLWATMKGEEPAPWMIAAEDESSWQGDPKRCEDVFKTARELADKNDWDVREIVLRVSFGDIDKAFLPATADATAETV